MADLGPLTTLVAAGNEGLATDQLAGASPPAGFAAAAVGIAPDGQSAERLASDMTLETLLIAVARLIDNIGVLSPDVAGRLRVVFDNASNINNVALVSTLTTVTTVANLTNQVNIGGIAANQQIPALTMMAEGDLRRNIVIS